MQEDVNERERRGVGTDLIREFVFFLIVEGQFIIEDIVQILLHKCHGVGETVLLVVSAVVHVRVITEDDTEY